MSDGTRAMWMRGGTSKGGYFLSDDLPADVDTRNRLLLSLMGSPDPRQIDGLGGADPLTSKVAVIRKSDEPDVDVDYLFLQVMVDRAIVSDSQNCGNILAGVGPFAIERGLVKATHPATVVRIRMLNTGQTALATVSTPNGRVSYAGEAAIDGVPGTHAAIPLMFQNTAGSSCGALLPTGRVCDRIEGFDCTLIDNGMPSVVMRATDLAVSGTETPEAMEANNALRSNLEAIRLKAGPMMNLGDVIEKSVPKMVMVSKPVAGGAICTRSFIPHTCHKAIGVLGAVSVATACLMPGSTASGLAVIGEGEQISLPIEHPTGRMTVVAKLRDGQIASAGILRTARKLFDGFVFAAEAG